MHILHDVLIYSKDKIIIFRILDILEIIVYNIRNYETDIRATCRDMQNPG